LHDFYRARKFNKISDVIRHKAILEQGGIYLDTDFQVSPQW
jgi:mannosyltransferase OCH1-like enzyme